MTATHAELRGDLEAPVLDPTHLRALASEASAEIVPVIAAEFLAEMQRRHKEIATSIAAAELDDLRNAAHALAGASGNLGARRLEHLAKRIEHLCTEGKSRDALSVAADLAAVMELTAAAIRGHIAKG